MKIILSTCAIFATLASCNPATMDHFVEGEATVLETLIAEEAKDIESTLSRPSRPVVIPITK